ncbi:MAG: DUF262 domain-containing HNH endonuclease family protein [Bacteroidota bacterium]
MQKHTLQTDRKYVMDIFSETSFYSIPEYQRPYVWKEQQIEDFLNDISSAMKHDMEKEYFLGCMIWNTKQVDDEANNSYECQDILDGQQRFITMYLLQGVMRDLSNDPQFSETVNKCLKQKENKFRRIPSRNRIVFEIREDAAFLEEFLLKEGKTLDFDSLKEISGDSSNYVSVRNIARGILIMHNWWTDKKKQILNDGKTEHDFQEYLIRFYTYLSTKVLVLYLATPDNLDDAYNLFTVLNSRGVQLQNGDILRAQNLRVIESEKLRKTYAQKWSDFENKIGVPFKNFDDFLKTLIDIKMKYSSDDNATILKAFDFLYKRGKNKGGFEKGIHMIESVGSYVKHFEAITNGTVKTPNSGKFFSNLDFILATTFGNQYLSIMMHYRECFGDYKIDDLLVKVDNLLSSTWLMGKRISSTRIYFILRRIDFHSDKISKEGLSRDSAAEGFLADPVLTYDYVDENSSAKPIDLDEFFDTLNSENWGGFSGTKINKTRYLLLKLDLLKISIYDSIQFNKHRSTIEHLMPRKISDLDWQIDKEEHSQWVHRLGNLVLLDRRKNSSLSNLPFTSKIEKYKSDIESRANTNFVFITYNENWNIDTIIHNHERVLSILKTYYRENSINALQKVRAIEDKPINV